MILKVPCRSSTAGNRSLNGNWCLAPLSSLWHSALAWGIQDLSKLLSLMLLVLGGSVCRTTLDPNPCLGGAEAKAPGNQEGPLLFSF